MVPIRLLQQYDELTFSIQNNLKNLLNNFDDLKKRRIKKELANLLAMQEKLIKLENDKNFK